MKYRTQTTRRPRKTMYLRDVYYTVTYIYIGTVISHHLRMCPLRPLTKYNVYHNIVNVYGVILLLLFDTSRKTSFLFFIVRRDDRTHNISYDAYIMYTFALCLPRDIEHIIF